MPWCEPCSRFLSPATVTADGRCPSCGRVVEPGRARSAPPAGSEAPPAGSEGASAVPEAVSREGLPPVPWHFKVLCLAASIYLGYRAFQGIDWLTQRL